MPRDLQGVSILYQEGPMVAFFVHVGITVTTTQKVCGHMLLPSIRPPIVRMRDKCDLFGATSSVIPIPQYLMGVYSPLIMKPRPVELLMSVVTDPALRIET